MGDFLSENSKNRGKKSLLEKLRKKLGITLSKRITKDPHKMKGLACMRIVHFDHMTTIGKTPDGSSRYDRIKKWHQIANSTSFRKKYNIKIVNEIRRICFRMHLPKNVEAMAFTIYRKARIAKVTNGRRYAWIAAASVYAACRVYNFSRTLDEFTEATNLHSKNIGRTYLVLKRELKINANASDPLSQVHRIALIAGIPSETEEIAIKLLEDQSYGGKPTTIAATALYLASELKGKKYTQSKLAKAAGINENTLRNCYQQYKEVFIQ